MAPALAPAATIGSPQELPGPVQACLAQGTCVVAPWSVFEAGGTAAFFFAEAGAPAYLVRYALWPTSTLSELSSRVELDPETGEAVVVTSRREERLGGAVWLRVAARYSSLDPVHWMTLYLDRVSPDAEPLPRWGSPGDLFPYALDFGLSTADLLAGGAYRELGLGPDLDAGSLQAAQPVVPCLADGCGVSQRLSLVHLSFSASGGDLVLGFDGGDPRARLYAEESRYLNLEGGFDSRRSFLVQAPLPGAAALFGPVVALLGPAHARRRRSPPRAAGGRAR
jgi:hypothetical protein